MQRNSGTYCDEPEDAGDYAAWLADFDLAARKADIDEITAGNAFMAELQARIVPLIVRYDVFWTRYFYQCAPHTARHLSSHVQCWLAGLFDSRAVMYPVKICLVSADKRSYDECMQQDSR